MEPPFDSDGLVRPGPESINSPLDGNGNTYLHELCARNAPPALIREAVRLGADVNALNKNNLPPLALAIRKSSPETAACLLDLGADMYFPAGKKDFFNACHAAAAAGRADMLDLVVTRGAGRYVNAPGIDEYGRSDGLPALHAAIKNHHDALIEPLVRAGAFPDREAGPDRLTPLHYAVANEAAGAIAQLIRLGADIDRPGGAAGQTPLHYAAAHNCPKAAEILLRKGAAVHAEDKRGMTPLHAAAEQGHNAVIEKLLPYDADVDRRRNGEKHETALMKAAAKGSYASVKLLLDAGANPMLADDFNRTAARYAEDSPPPSYNYGYYDGGSQRTRNLLQEAEEKAARRFFEKKYRNRRP